MKIAVLGDGCWGTTLSILLKNKGHSVSLWGVFKENIDTLNKYRENRKFLPGIKLPGGIIFSSDISEVCLDADFIVLAIPSRFLREVLFKNKEILKRDNKKAFISVIKGIEQGSLKRMSEVVFEILGMVKLAILSGPSIAPEVSRGVPTAVVSASTDDVFARKVQDVFITERFRVYTNKDVIGVELGGALKNIIAIAVGISDGLGFGANTKSAILTRGLVEISRLGVALGASLDTFRGLSGLGDLITSSISLEGRNRSFGEKIGKGYKLDDILKQSIMEIEGIWTTKSAVMLGEKYNLELPISKEVYSVLFENKSPLLAVQGLMTREPKQE